MNAPSKFFGTGDRSVQDNANEIGVKRARKETIRKRGRIYRGGLVRLRAVRLKNNGW